jgi:tRNA (cytidine/uridine-2'-O-)-methyltransferase
MSIEIQAADFRVDTPGAAPLHVVLVEPEIPPNTGSIARLCAGTGAWLHLVEPLGFDLDHRKVKRAGLDYWPSVRLSVHRSWQALAQDLPWERTWLFSARATSRGFHEVRYERGSVLVFGRETKGLPSELVDRAPDRLLRIPTTGSIRSLNLAQAAAVGVFEVLRQVGYPDPS